MLETLFIVFLVLKLLGVVTWSWWFVFLPLIIDFVVFTYFYVRKNISPKYTGTKHK